MSQTCSCRVGSQNQASWRAHRRKRPTSKAIQSASCYSRPVHARRLGLHDTFAPVAKQVTIRALFAVATKNGCMLKAGDIETAFLAADMDCEVWVKMPSFWGRGDDEITRKCDDLPPRKLL